MYDKVLQEKKKSKKLEFLMMSALINLPWKSIETSILNI